MADEIDTSFENQKPKASQVIIHEVVELNDNVSLTEIGKTEPDTSANIEIVEVIETAPTPTTEKVKEYFPREKATYRKPDDKTEIARRQLEMLNSIERKNKKQTSVPQTTTQEPIQIVVKSDSGEETYKLSSSGLEKETTKSPIKTQVPSTIILKNSPNLTSTILSKSEMESEIIKKCALTDRQDSFGTIEIPQEMILSSELSELASPNRIIVTESAPQLESQELIDILEGKDDVSLQIDGSNIVVDYTDSSAKHEEVANYEIEMSEGMESEIEEIKSKIIEREIALRQIMTLPKNKKGRLPRSMSPKTMTLKTINQGKSNARQLVDSLVSEWTDEKTDSDDGAITYEIKKTENGEITLSAPVLPSTSQKTENVNILTKATTASSSKQKKSPPKILNKNAPSPVKILNKEAHQKTKSAQPTKSLSDTVVDIQAKEPQAYKRQRIIKKKTIWDPSDTSEVSVSYSSLVSTERKGAGTPEPKTTTATKASKLPAGITIKKITSKVVKPKDNGNAIEEQKETEKKKKDTKPTAEVTADIKEETTSSESEQEIVEEKKPVARKQKKRSEIDKLLGDEGAVNMIYSLERENNNSDVPEIEVKPNKKSLINVNKEKNVLLTKAKTIKNIVMKQSTSPGATGPLAAVSRARMKKETTPVSEPEPKVATKPVAKKTVGRKRKAQDSASGDWDSSFYGQCEDSMIIRRRSNSSYDSSAATSPRRLSVDISGSTASSETPQPKDDKFEFVKPTEKVVSPEEKIITPNLIAEMKGKLNKAIKKNKEETTETTPRNSRKRPQTTAPEDTTSPPSKVRVSDRKVGEFHEIQVQRFDNFVHVELAPSNEGKLKDVLTVELMNEMRTLLGQLKTDINCKVVLVTSASDTFSNGLDFSSLVQSTISDRKGAASDVATAVKNFLVSLVAFPKILICGVNGPTKNLGVTMLTLFDAVCATEKATFRTDYGQIGQIPEGLSLLSITGKIRGSAISDLLYLGEVLTSVQAQNYGLVTKILSPANKFQEQLYNYCKKTAAMSSQYLESTKALLSEDLLDSIETYLTSEIKTLQQQWISTECQEKFKNYLTKEEW